MNTLLRTSLTSFGLLSLVMMVGPTSCAAIVGADDYQVGVAPGTAGTSTGQSGSQVGVGGSDGTGGSGTGGSRPGSGGSRNSDASVPSDAIAPKPESSVTPPKGDAKSDVVVPDTGTGGKPVGSGEALCTTTCTGAGLTCQHTAFGPSGLCTYLCGDVSECDTTHDCIGSGNAANQFNYACLKKCPTHVCPTGMACLPIATVGPVCLPTDWLPKNLGLGDDCVADSQCTSGQCVNKPNGWCSRPCVAFDLCNGAYADGTNYYDEYNWCINVLGGYKCAPGCLKGVSDAVCANYPGTVCKTVSDIDSSDIDVCTF